MGVSKLSDVERPRLGDAVYKHPLKPQMFAVDPLDNLPRAVSAVSMEDTVAPPLDPETFICMGDESSFVLRDKWGEVQLTLAPDRVRFSRQEGSYLASVEKLSEQERAVVLSVLGEHGDWFPVEARRPQCFHYKRVMTSFENDKKIKHVERVCSAQRGESGEYVSLADTEVFACEHRVPRDFVSEDRLRVFDERRVAEGKKSVEEWNPEEIVTRSLGPRPKGERA